MQCKRIRVQDSQVRQHAVQKDPSANTSFSHSVLDIATALLHTGGTSRIAGACPGPVQGNSALPLHSSQAHRPPPR